MSKNKFSNPLNPKPLVTSGGYPIHFLKLLIYLGVFTSFLGIALIGFAIYHLDNIGFFNDYSEEVSKFANYTYRDNSIIVDRNGIQISELYKKDHSFIPFDKIPDALKKAVIAIEDKNFYSHSGYDFLAMFRAGIKNLQAYVDQTGRIQGASTITQQIARHMFLSNERSLNRKLKEIAIARSLEKKVSKQKLLEFYLNALYLGNRSYGVGAAAENYFQKKPIDLEVHEIAFLAGLYQAPSRYDPYKNPKAVKQRQIQVLKAMVDTKVIEQKDYNKWVRKKLVFKRPVKSNIKNNYYIDYIKAQAQRLIPNDIDIYNSGITIHTTFDLNIQNKVENITKQYMQKIKPINSRIFNPLNNQDSSELEIAALTIDRTTGEIATMIGGKNYKKSQFNRAIQAKRPSGSAFKPIVYAYALTQGYKWNDVFYIYPLNFDGYRPKNYDSSFLTESTLLRALYKSINTPAVDLANKLHIEKIINFAHKLGIESKLRNELGTAIGSSETTLMDMARAYSVFANSGNLVEPISITKIEDKNKNIIFQSKDLISRTTPVMSPTESFLMAEGLKTVFRYGTAASYGYLHRNSAGKTGTSNNSRDNWFCGFNSKYITIVWVGIEGPGYLGSRYSASNLALPYWSNIMTTISTESLSESKPEVPENVSSILINPKYGYMDKDGGIEMWFSNENMPTANENKLFQGISYNKGYRKLIE